MSKKELEKRMLLISSPQHIFTQKTLFKVFYVDVYAKLAMYTEKPLKRVFFVEIAAWINSQRLTLWIGTARRDGMFFI
jgi:hypothetical protein